MPSDSETTELTLTTPILGVPGVGKKRAAVLARLGIEQVGDLIKHLPHRHEYHAGQLSISQLPVDTIATARGEVANCRFVPTHSSPIGGFRGGRRGRFQITLEDSTGRMDVTWFNGGFLQSKIHPGVQLQVTGKVGQFRGYYQMVNPKWQIVEEEPQEPVGDERFRPVYPATEELSSAQIETLVEQVLPQLLPQIEDHLSPAFRDERNFPALADAYRMMHQPQDPDEVGLARRRLAYDEFLMLQMGIAVKRHFNRAVLKAPVLKWNDAIDAHIRERFPFQLTESQDQVVREIAGDLQRSWPMNRLIQGDVGSGKTVVALYAMLMAVASGCQGALMAPTELLAEQHYLSISNMLEGSTVRLALLTGSQSKAERESLLGQVERGEIDLIIGTQALLTETVQFSDLAVVVVDEQHRFGVSQRAAIRAKSGEKRTVPHYLIMTATPIPRTLSMTVFGDLEVSTIAGLPPGRQPIITRAVDPGKTPDVYNYIARRLKEGEQAYVVVPAIDEGEMNLKAVRTHAKELEETFFRDFKVAAIHGQLKRETRERIMHQFRAGKIDVLVATTVIEVGVDVPNASIMVVEHAERFGLAQLHQLRGRVGRGSKRSLCVFIAQPTTEEARQRIDAIAGTTDGFAIAEADLQIRGMGEFFGTRQHGATSFRVARIPEDMALLRLAARDSKQIVEADPRLEKAEHRLLRGRLVRQYGEALGLADVG